MMEGNQIYEHENGGTATSHDGTMQQYLHSRRHHSTKSGMPGSASSKRPRA